MDELGHPHAPAAHAPASPPALLADRPALQTEVVDELPEEEISELSGVPHADHLPDLRHRSVLYTVASFPGCFLATSWIWSMPSRVGASGFSQTTDLPPSEPRRPGPHVPRAARRCRSGRPRRPRARRPGRGTRGSSARGLPPPGAPDRSPRGPRPRPHRPWSGRRGCGAARWSPRRRSRRGSDPMPWLPPYAWSADRSVPCFSGSLGTPAPRSPSEIDGIPSSHSTSESTTGSCTSSGRLNPPMRLVVATVFRVRPPGARVP